MTIQERAAAALAESRRQADAEKKRREAEEQAEKNREAEEIVNRYLGLQATAVNGRVTVDGVTLAAYSRRDYDSHSRTYYLHLVGPCPHCGAEVRSRDLADSWGNAWAALGKEFEAFTPASDYHADGQCLRDAVNRDIENETSITPLKPTPAQVLLDALTAYIDQVCQRHANDE
jgi:hypothetical protein